MKNKFTQKIIAFALTLVLLAGCFSGCGPNTEYIVQFECGAGSSISAQTVRHGKTISSAEVPTREGYVFEGWYQDANLTKAWDARKDKVQSDLTLYASWDRNKDFSGLRTPGSQEGAYEYTSFSFLPWMVSGSPM